MSFASNQPQFYLKLNILAVKNFELCSHAPSIKIELGELYPESHQITQQRNIEWINNTLP